MQRPVNSHSPLARTSSPRFAFTVESLMSKQPLEMHEHLLCLSLEVNRLAELAMSNASKHNSTSSSSHAATPPPRSNAHRVSFSAASPSALSEGGTAATSVNNETNVDQTISAVRKRLETMLYLSSRRHGHGRRSSTIETVYDH